MASLMSSLGGKDYFELVKSIGESKSKQEEDRIIAEEVIYLKKAVNQAGITKKKLKELVIRAVYVEMLGQDASFAYIKAVEICASTSITQKKVGYLAASLCLSPSHEFRFMLVNQIQRDMKSTNMLDVSAALVAVCRLVTEDMIPAVITDVLNLLKHDMEPVRKKAISALHRFYQMDKRSVLDHVDKIRRALCDKDPCVMAATLPLFQAMIQDDALMFKDLVPSFVSILKQIVEHRLPREYDYHRIPSPWIQMALLKILSLLGRGDQAASEGMYEVLVDAMKRADTGINVGYAIVYECVQTVTTIYPNTLLMDAAATAISRFIRSDSHNLKYIGIKGLASIVKDHPKYAADHQLAVIDCLEDPDETLKRKTLDLLFRMTNAVNVEFIVDKLLSFLGSSADDHFRSDLVNQITQCAERFAPSNTWYVQTIIKVFELAGDKVKTAVAQTLTQLIAEGAEIEGDDEVESDAKDNELRTEAVEHFLDLLESPKIPSILAQTMSWVLGEYGYLSTSCSKEVIMDKLCQLFLQSSDSETKAHIITALSKLIAQSGTCPSKVLQNITFYAQSQSVDVQQRCREVLALLKSSGTMADVLPIDASCEDIEVDENLSFLGNFVQTALNLGASPYNPPKEFLPGYGDDDDSEKKPTLKITPYAMPTIPTAPAQRAVSAVPAAPGAAPVAPTGPTPLGPALNNQQPPPLSIATAQGNQLINTRGVAQVWGKKPEPPPPAPVVAAPSPVPEPAKTSGYESHSSQPTSPTSQPFGASSSNAVWGAPSSSTTSPAAIAAAPAAPAQPRVLTEKEKMAAALFGGMSGAKPAASSSGSAGAAKRRSVTGATASAAPPGPVTAAPAASAAPPAELDIFQNMNTSIQSSAPQAPPAASSGGITDLLDMMGTPAPISSSNSFAPPPPPVPQQPVSLVDDFLSLSAPAPPVPVRGLGGYGAPTAPAPAPAVNSNANLISDVFSSMDISSTPLTPSVVDNIRPLVINTAEFGKRWGTTPIEQKQTVSCMHMARLDLEVLRRALPSTYHHVESIPSTMEAIFAATATNIGAVLLIHAKINVPRKSCDIMVKSTSHEVASREIQAIATSFSNFRG